MNPLDYSISRTNIQTIKKIREILEKKSKITITSLCAELNLSRDNVIDVLRCKAALQKKTVG